MVKRKAKLVAFTESRARRIRKHAGGVHTSILNSNGPRIGGGAKLYRFTLNESWTSGAADADILEMDGTDTTIDADVLDPLGIFSALTTGDAGLCMRQNGLYYVIQAPCPS